MRKKIFVIYLISMFLTACAAFENKQAIQATVTRLIPSTTVIRHAEMTASPTISAPTATIYTKKKISPANRNVIFGNENFRSKFDLFVRKNNTISMLNLITGKTQFEQPVFENDFQLKMTTNPKNDLIAYITYLPSILRVTNLKDSTNSVMLPAKATSISWVNDNEIAVWGDDGTCPYLIYIYNIHTKNKAIPTHPLSGLDQLNCSYFPSFNETGTLAMFPWTVFNFVTGDSKIVSFLQNAPTDPPAYATRLSNNQLSAFYFDEDKLYYVLNLPVEKVNNGVLNEVSLPGFATRSGWWRQSAWSPDKMQIGVDLITDARIDPIMNLVEGKKVPMEYHLIRLDTHEIIDYDLDRELFEKDPIQDTYSGESYFSPDGRYIAWTINIRRQSEPLESKVLDQETGFIITIPNAQVLGWSASDE